MIEENNGRPVIIISELPYQVNKARLIEKIAELVKEKKIEGISELRDESDKDGLRVVIELRRGEKFVWPLRFTAVVVRQPEGWKFAQMNFSFPTVYFPDVRFVDGD